MAKVHDFLEMWQDSENLWATQKALYHWNKQITTMGYISDKKQTVKLSWSAFEHDGIAGVKMTEKSPLPPSLLQTELSGTKTKVRNIHWVYNIYLHSTESDDDSYVKTNSDNDYRLHWNSNLDNWTYNENDCKVYNEDVMNLSDDSNVIHEAEESNVPAIPNVAHCIRLVWKLKHTAAIFVINYSSTNI